MSTSYDGTLLDHLAEHMIYLSTASSFWFSPNLSNDHVPMTGSGGKQLSATTRDVHAPKRKEMRSTTVGGGGGGVRHGHGPWPSWLLHCLSPSSCCATLLFSLCTSFLLHRLSSSSCCALLSSSCYSCWLLGCILTCHHPRVVSLSHHATISTS